jgi:hypothetical protein
LSCIPDYFGYDRPYYVPVNRRIERAWLARSKSYAAACDENAGAPHGAGQQRRPRKVWYQANLDQDVAFDRVINIWFGWIAFLPAGYAQFLWPGLAEVFAAWVHNGDAQALKDAYDSAVGPGDDNLYAVYLASSAPTPPGRGTGTGGAATTGGCASATRSSPGPTPGSTRPARSGAPGPPAGEGAGRHLRPTPPAGAGGPGRARRP